MELKMFIHSKIKNDDIKFQNIPNNGCHDNKQHDRIFYYLLVFVN